jgi:hypothetical protein
VADDGPYRFLLRMPQSLRAELHDAARRNGRSLNLEIVGRLEASIARPAVAARRRRALGIGAVALALGAAALLSVAGGEGTGDAAAGFPAGPGLKYALTVDAGRAQTGP